MQECCQAQGMQVPPIELRTGGRWNPVRDNPDPFPLSLLVPSYRKTAHTWISNQIKSFIPSHILWKVFRVLYKPTVRNIASKAYNTARAHHTTTSCLAVGMTWHPSLLTPASKNNQPLTVLYYITFRLACEDKMWYVSPPLISLSSDSDLFLPSQADILGSRTRPLRQTKLPNPL